MAEKFHEIVRQLMRLILKLQHLKGWFFIHPSLETIWIEFWFLIPNNMPITSFLPVHSVGFVHNNVSISPGDLRFYLDGFRRFRFLIINLKITRQEINHKVKVLKPNGIFWCLWNIYPIVMEVLFGSPPFCSKISSNCFNLPEHSAAPANVWFISPLWIFYIAFLEETPLFVFLNYSLQDLSRRRKLKGRFGWKRGVLTELWRWSLRRSGFWTPTNSHVQSFKIRPCKK